MEINVEVMTLKVEGGAFSQKCEEPLKAGKSKEMCFPLQHPEGTQLCGPIRLLTSRKLRE